MLEAFMTEGMPPHRLVKTVFTQTIVHGHPLDWNGASEDAPLFTYFASVLTKD